MKKLRTALYGANGHQIYEFVKNSPYFELVGAAAIPEGLVAIEAYYSGYDGATTERALATVRKFNILPSGGSDFHGEKRPGVSLGVGRDNLAIPASVEESLATFSAR